MKAPLPAYEKECLQGWQDSGILDSAAGPSYHQLTELAASICTSAIAMLSLIDSDREWFKSRAGVSFRQTSRDVAFCAHAMLQRDLLIVPDTISDERFAAKPLVTSEPHIRFCPGAPLITSEGYSWARFACTTMFRENSVIRNVRAGSVELAGGHPD